MPSTVVQSDSSTKSDQEIVNSHETDTQNRLFDQDDLETFVLLFLIIYMLSLQHAITTWCWETLQNFVRFICNNSSIKVLLFTDLSEFSIFHFSIFSSSFSKFEYISFNSRSGKF